jgi:hypothetical protein
MNNEIHEIYELESFNETDNAITLINARGRPENYEKNNEQINIQLSQQIVRIEFKHEFTFVSLNKISVFILLILQRLFGRFRRRIAIDNVFVEYINEEHNISLNLSLINVTVQHLVIYIIQHIHYNNNANNDDVVNITPILNNFYKLNIDVINKIITGVDILSRERNTGVVNVMKRNAGLRRFAPVALKEKYEHRYESPVAGFNINIPGESRGSRGSQSTLIIPVSKKHRKQRKIHRKTHARKRRAKTMRKKLKQKVLKDLLMLNNEF